MVWKVGEPTGAVAAGRLSCQAQGQATHHGLGTSQRLRDETDDLDKMGDRVEHDVYYIENLSL